VSNRDHIRDSIKTEVATQVTQEVEMQIRDYLPSSLTQQAVDTKKGIADMKIALANSSAFCFPNRTDILTPIWLQ
jgi:hypothetical protein